MKHSFANFAVAAAVALGGIGGVTAAEIEIRHATEIEFQVERGHYYQLQRSTNLVDWQNVDDSIYGHGGHERRLRSARPDDGSNHEYVRVVISDAPTNGFAPWALTGISMELDDEPGGDLMKFNTATVGLDVSEDSDPFSYAYTRLSANEAKAELTYASNRIDKLTFAFTGPGVGTWSRDEYRDGKLKDHDAGPFRITGIAPTTGGTNAPVVNPYVIVAPPVAPPAPPASLSNLVYYFQSSGVPDRYDFLDDHNGREVQGVVQEGLPTNALVYAYTVLNSNTASLNLSFGYYGMGGDRYQCDLTFTDGSSGHFVRRLYRRGVLKDTDSGAFSQNMQLAPSGSYTTPPANTNTAAVWPPVLTPTAPPAPPASLFGKTYFVYTAPSPDQYQFSGQSYGYATPGASQSEEIETSPGGNVYMYTYTDHGSNTASLVITYGYYNLGGDREEYDLTYVDGSTATFNRRLYRLGTLYTNQAGIFSTNSVLPYAYNGGGSTNNPPPGDYDFFMNTGEYLKFTSATAGLQTDNSNPTDFTYVLTSTGANTATLRVQFKADKWDEYDLTYAGPTAGTFIRRQYDADELKDTDSGSFNAKAPGQ
jgi:hypothetical protein